MQYARECQALTVEVLNRASRLAALPRDITLRCVLPLLQCGYEPKMLLGGRVIYGRNGKLHLYDAIPNAIGCAETKSQLITWDSSQFCIHTHSAPAHRKSEKFIRKERSAIACGDDLVLYWFSSIAVGAELYLDKRQGPYGFYTQSSSKRVIQIEGCHNPKKLLALTDTAGMYEQPIVWAGDEIVHYNYRGYNDYLSKAHATVLAHVLPDVLDVTYVYGMIYMLHPHGRVTEWAV